MSRNGKESDILKACQDLLTAERIPWLRINSGKVKTAHGSWIQLAPKGTPDLLAHVPYDWKELCGSKPYRVVWIECKRRGGKLSAEQLAFGDAARNRGEVWIVLDDVKVLQDWLAENAR